MTDHDKERFFSKGIRLEKNHLCLTFKTGHFPGQNRTTLLTASGTVSDYQLHKKWSYNWIDTA
jgi:hypothetical protein